MGLDIYFEKRKIKSNEKPVEVAYFRKVNFLVGYFDYEENCSYKTISKSEIVELLDRCQEVLDNHLSASELLPVQEGFFFGSYDYDKWYFEDVREVQKTFTKLLEEINFNEEELLMYCWW